MTLDDHIAAWRHKRAAYITHIRHLEWKVRGQRQELKKWQRKSGHDSLGAAHTALELRYDALHDAYNRTIEELDRRTQPPPTANPYPPETAEHHIWTQGWNAAHTQG